MTVLLWAVRARAKDTDHEGRREQRLVGHRSPGRPDLEGLRAVAVVGVVIYHLRNSWLPGGFAGVDVFFVLSGYFITGLLIRELADRGRIDLLTFWGRRARRLLPAAALVSVLTLLTSLLLVNAIDARRFGADALWVSVFSANWHFAQQGASYLADTDRTPFTHFWSLGVEEQFYLCWPVLLSVVVLSMRAATQLPARLAILASGLGVASFSYAWQLTSTNQPYAYFGTFSRVWQLALGALLAAGSTQLARLPELIRRGLRWAGLSMIVAFYVAAPLDIDYPSWHAAIPAVAAAAVIGAGFQRCESSHRQDRLVRLLGSRLAQGLGRYSYGWYLWHWPPLVLLPLIVDRRLTVVELISCALVTLATAIGSYHLVELPVRMHPRLVTRHGLSLALGFGLVAAVAASSGIALAVATYRTTHTEILTPDGHRLDPQPGVAAAEAPRPQIDGCEVPLRATTPSPQCRYLPDTGHGDIILVGDSHAVQWEPAVEDVARGRGWGLRIWARQSCSFAAADKPIGGAMVACRAWRTDITHRLLAARPSLVIVGDYDSIPSQIVDPASGNVIGGPQAAAATLNGLETQLRLLRQAGISVLLIRDDPRFAQNGPKCVLNHPHHLSSCSRDRQTALPYRIEELAAQRVSGTTIFDPTGTLCDPIRCNQVVGHILAYRDDNHLTREFVTSTETQLQIAIRSAIRT